MMNAISGAHSVKLRPLLEGPRVRLREVRVSDVTPAYYRWLNDPEVTRYLATRPPQSRAQIRDYVKRMRDDPADVFLAIVVRRVNRHIGNIKLGPIDWLNRRSEVSLVIGEKTYWHRGYGTEAISLVAAHAFETLDLHRLEAGCVSDNIASERAFVRAGFRREGILRERWLVDNRYMDHLWLGRVRSGGRSRPS